MADSAPDPASLDPNVNPPLSSGDTQPNTQPASANTSFPPPPTHPSQQQQPPPLPNGDASFSAQQEQDLDAEIHPSSTNDTIMPDALPTTSFNSAAPSTALPAADPNPLPAVLEPRIPHKKDTSLREFLSKTDDYTPLIPDAVTDYYLTLAGLPPPPETDRRLARVLALATQKFIADIAADAYQYSRIRSTNTTSNNPLTGLGGAAGFGMSLPHGGGAGDGDGVSGGGASKAAKKDAGKSAPLGGPRAGYGGGGASNSQGRTVLTMEDLGMAVGEYGVNVKRGEFYR